MALINPPPLQEVKQSLATWFIQVYTLCLSLQESGTTANRPVKNLWIGRRYFDTTLNQECIYTGTTWLLSGGGGGGEVNTASNVGVGGVGLYKSKTGVNLDFRNINAGSSKVSVTLDAVNNEVDIDVVTANITGIAPSAISGTAVITTDPRLSDARTPTAHGHAQSDITNLITDLSAKKTDSMSTNKLLGRGTALTGVIEEITLGTNLSLSGTTLNATGGGSGATYGNATIDFSTGSNEASIVVIGQTSITLTATINAFIMADDTTADHTASDHKYAPTLFSLSCGDLVAGTGFTIYARSIHKISGTFKVRFAWSN